MSSHVPAFVGSRWFELLFVFVSFNTIIYASLALAKLWPKRRE